MNDLIFFISDIKEYIILQFYSKDIYDWMLFFFPLVLFFEVPRYFFPGVFLYILKLLGYRRGHRLAEKEFLDSEPSVSIIIAGRNESAIIANTIESLLAIPYKNKEIIVVDDASDDNMYEICKEYADKGLIRLFGNFSETGRAGRPSSSNYGFRMSTGEFIISVDADTSYDYDIIEHMIGPFHDPEVGGVAGNLKARNLGASFWADCQAIEYMISIGLWKRWTDLIGTTMQASGAFGAFRRETLLDFGGWDPELAEDADLSLKAKKCGWKIAFAPDAIAMTSVPEDLWTLVKQRIRWDKGALRTYFHKHKDIMKFWQFKFSIFFELAQEFFASYILTFVYFIYLVYMISHNYKLLILAYCVTYVLYSIMTFFTFLIALSFSERSKEERGLLWYIGFMPFYKEIFRWVRFYANILETFRLKYEESYIPESGYKNKEKW